MSHNCRCIKCMKRVTIRHRLDWYLKPPICQACKGKLYSTNDYDKARNKRLVCNCDGYHFPHRKGTEPWCCDAKIGPDEEDYRLRHCTIL